MAPAVLVDTDILIDFERGVEQAADCLDRLEAQARPAISVVTQMELIVGCRGKQELNALDRFLKRFEIITIDAVIAETAVDLLRQFCLSHGLLIADALIAATALVLEAPLLTGNQRHFRFIEGLRGLPYS